MDSGIYLLKSRSIDYKYIYKVGKTISLTRRLSEYPPNYHVILTFKCEDINNSEREIIKMLNDADMKEMGLNKCKTGNEYFECVLDIDNYLIFAIKFILKRITINVSFYNEDNNIISPIIKVKKHENRINNKLGLNHQGNIFYTDLIYKEWTQQARFQRRHLFLTWSHDGFPFTKENVEQMFKNKFSNHNIAYVIVVEIDKNGKPHTHMLLTCLSGIFDLTDKYRLCLRLGESVYKPCIISPKSTKDIAHLVWCCQKEDKEPLYVGYSRSDGKKKN